jgi:hypothetical protein
VLTLSVCTAGVEIGYPLTPPLVVASEGGLVGAFTMRLTAPVLDGVVVTLPIASLNASAATAWLTNVTFTGADWDVWRTVNVSGTPAPRRVRSCAV